MPNKMQVTSSNFSPSSCADMLKIKNKKGKSKYGRWTTLVYVDVCSLMIKFGEKIIHES